MSKNKFLNKKINRIDNDILSESDIILSLDKRNELSEKYFENAIKEKDSKNKQTLLEKAYNLNNTKFEVVKEYLEILDKNGENHYSKRYQNVKNVFNFINFKYSKKDLISFFDDLDSYTFDSVGSFERLVEKKKKKLMIILIFLINLLI